MGSALRATAYQVQQMKIMRRMPAWCSGVGRSIAAPLLIAAILRLGLLLAAWLRTGTRIITQGDTESYLQPGRNLIFHGIYAAAGRPEIDRTPGYPIFLMLAGMAVNNVLITGFVQIIVSLFSLVLIYKIANRSFPNSRAGLIAAWLFALDPVSIVYTVRLLPETLFVLLLLISIERLLAFHGSGKLSRVASAGLSLAAATYVRPVSYYLVLPLAAALAFALPKNSWKAPAVLLLATAPLLGAWQVRNAIETGYSGFSSIVEKNLYFYQSAEVTAELHGISLHAEQSALGYDSEESYLAVHPEQRSWTISQRLRYMRSQSVAILSQHRLAYLRSHFKGVGLVALTPAATELLQLVDLYPQSQSMPSRVLNEGIFRSTAEVALRHPGVMSFMVIMTTWVVILYALAAQSYRSGSASRFASVLLAGIAIYFLLISGGPQAVGRYRVPIMPELCILAAGGLVALRTKAKRGHQDPAYAVPAIM